jgi:hypothetical protein
MKNNELMDILRKLPQVDDYLGRLFNYFGSLDKILLDTEGSIIYHNLMIKVISKYEFDLGNYTIDGMIYKLNKNSDDIIKEYGGTFLLPLL